MISDKNIQALPGSQIHNGDQGVGGHPARLATIDQKIKAPAMVLTVAGFTNKNDFEDVDFYLYRPLPDGVSKCCFSYDLTLDKDSVLNGQAVETDIEVVRADGNKYNTSLQNDYFKGGQLQVSSPSKSWVPTGGMPGKYAPDIKHHVQIFNAFDFVKKASSTLAVVIDDVLYLVPANLQRFYIAGFGWFNRDWR